MADLLFIAVTIAFFGLATLLVRACDHIVGPDLDLPVEVDPDSGVDLDAPVETETAVVR